MPIYEYKCLKCQKLHEIIQKFSDPALEECPDCAGQLQKAVSLSSFALKGQGWYTTDYKRSSSEPKTTSESQSQESSSPAASSSSTPSAPSTPAPTGGACTTAGCGSPQACTN